MSAGMGESALVCRGGTCTARRFAEGAGVSINQAGNLQGVSVNSAPRGDLRELTATIPNRQVGVTTVGQIIAAGGTLTPTPRPNNPYHCTMGGITLVTAEELFTPTVRNPSVP
jgi:hypothetical protein